MVTRNARGHVVELYALGILSAKTARDIASAAHRSAPRPQTEVLAKLGAGGEYTNNINRDLQRKLALGSNNLPQPVYVELPMWSTSADGTHTAGKVFQKIPIPPSA